ncbi:MAG: hypothetical protein OXD29_03350 [Roseovarius sp.]|nr:hypothetical protein [Roseovarius sp.]MCY4206972.1 hypothetical protein [Roseovarius sp.]
MNEPVLASGASPSCGSPRPICATKPLMHVAPGANRSGGEVTMNRAFSPIVPGVLPGRAQAVAITRRGETGCHGSW